MKTPPDLCAVPVTVTLPFATWSEIIALMQLGAAAAPQTLGRLLADISAQVSPQTAAARAALQRASQQAVEKTVVAEESQEMH